MKKSLKTQSYKEFVEHLKMALKNPLPGILAHQEMAAKVSSQRKLYKYDSYRSLTGAVLIHFHSKDSVILLTVIERQKYDGVHSGQISFPGGKKDDKDASVVETALREAEEEVNISSSEVEVIGKLTPLYISASDFMVHPIIAYSNSIPDFIPETKEVAEIINFPLEKLIDDSIIKNTLLTIRGTQIYAPYFEIEDKIVWGATAMILNELKNLIKSFTT